MIILDGKKTSNDIKAEIAESVKGIVANGSRPPHLAAVIVGNDGASLTYVSSKVRAYARTLLLTYVRLAPSLPTITAAKCGGLEPFATIPLTDSAISAFISLLVFFPSKIIIFPSCFASFASFYLVPYPASSSSFYSFDQIVLITDLFLQ